MRSLSCQHWLTVLFLSLFFLALLALGGLKLRRDFLTRGIPDGLPPPIPYGGAELGLNVYLLDASTEEQVETLAEVAATGVTTVKQSFYYDEAFDWEASDRLISAVVGQGLQLVPLLDGNPEDEFTPPNDPADFARWAAAFAARYGEEVDAYIIWDEPNLSSHWGGGHVNPAEYAALLSAAATAIRASDPEAVIVAAPLAPTQEEGPYNLADPLFLRALYEAGIGGVFDVVAAKPYGFDEGPLERAVALDRLNFSRAILLREVLLEFGDEGKAVWAGNWGWNALPADWQGEPSIWGETDEATQATYTVEGLTRARREWPWMGLMFLENWEPGPGPGGAAPDDPRWGFSIAGRPAEAAISALPRPQLAYPGFHLAQEQAVGQDYQGEWRFSPVFGADIGNEAGDRVSLDFWGTAVGARVRRADFRGRFYATIDGQPAENLPEDEETTALVLTSPEKDAIFLDTVLVAEGLAPGAHTLTLQANGGWGQWALNGFSVAYHPADGAYRAGLGLVAAVAVLSLLLAGYSARRARWAPLGQTLSGWRQRLGKRSNFLLTWITAGLVGLSGWLTWGAEAAGLYRRLGDQSQLALTAAAASIFYVTPFFFVYVAALLVLFFLLYARPAWGLALVAFSFPLAVKPKPLLGYRFAPAEVFLLVTLGAWLASLFIGWLLELRRGEQPPLSLERVAATLRRWRGQLVTADYAVLAFLAVATVSLFFTERLDVALNEWRVVIVEPALFYLILRAAGLSRREMWTVLDAFILGGVFVAVYGLLTYRPGGNVITVPGGLLRLRSLFGSPNNVALYLGRVLPFLVAMIVVSGAQRWRRLAYGIALVPVGLALVLTFSKGAYFLGVPVALLIILILWRRTAGGRVWPWLAGVALLGLLALLVGLAVPAIATRLDLQGATSVARFNLWQASLNMFADHPIFGVGLDNFLYQYRGRYIFDAAWREPDLNHPHNILLDFATRLGLLGLLAGAWMLWSLGSTLWRLRGRVSAAWRPVAVGIVAAFGNMLAHGLVDHSFFLIELAFAFFLLLGMAVWLGERSQDGNEAQMGQPRQAD